MPTYHVDVDVEVLPLTQTQINILSKYHISNLRRFQSIPIRTARCAVYLLIGALPLEAELHKRQLGLVWGFGRWVGAWCLSVAGPAVAQLGAFFGSDCLWVVGPFLCFIVV